MPRGLEKQLPANKRHDEGTHHPCGAGCRDRGYGVVRASHPRGEGQPKILPVRLDRFSDRRMPCLSRPILRIQRQTGVMPFTLRQLAAAILKETGWDLPPLPLVWSPRMARCAGLFVAEKDARGSGGRSGSPSRSCGAWAGPGPSRSAGATAGTRRPSRGGSEDGKKSRIRRGCYEPGFEDRGEDPGTD